MRQNYFYRTLKKTSWFFGLISFTALSQTIQYSFTGGMQTYIVPSGVTSLAVTVAGAQGGNIIEGNYTRPGGQGGIVNATIAVTPGETINLFVGGAGATNSGGYNGGGNNSNGGAGGGGASDIRIGSTGLSDRVIVAGGGGGAAVGSNAYQGGHGGGLIGANGSPSSDISGKGGTQSNGGLRGTAGACQGSGYSGADGAFGLGGNASYLSLAGSGGGGFYGGGGGATNLGGSCPGSGGGGGGSSNASTSRTSNVAMTQGGNLGNGFIKITAASASAVPLVFTQPAINVTSNSANLIGLINSNGNNLQTSFDYGIESNLTNYVHVSGTPATIPAGSAYTVLSATIENLSANTTYFYRANASTISGTTSGEILFFTTSGTLDIEDFDRDDNIVLYPNPAFNRLYVKSDLQLNISIMTIDGKLLFSSFDKVIDISSAQAGLYIVTFKDGEKILKSEKLIIKSL